MPEPSRPEEFRSPILAHVPTTSLAPETPAPRRRVLAAVAASASVAALGLTFALPLATQSGEAPPAAAATQRLFSETDLAAAPPLDSFSEVPAVISDSAVPTDFAYRPEAVVNFPIPQHVMLTDPFGYRTAPVEQFHDAQDFAAAAGTDIHAIADGEVLEAGFAGDGCGFGLKLEHRIDAQEVTSRYCHMEMDSHELEPGDEVRMGEVVGRVGSTGLAFGAHLHLALRIDDVPVDPMPFLNRYSRAGEPLSRAPRGGRAP